MPAHVDDNPALGTWVAVEGDVVTVGVGKVELGQGVLTALHQVAADALGLPGHRVRVLPARTDRGPDQGVTAGSLSVTQSTPALRHVGAAVRQLAEAPDGTSDAEVHAYVERIARVDPHTDLRGLPLAGAPGTVALVGADEPRIDLPDKVLGRPRFLTDLRPEGLLHARVLRPPSPAARLVGLPDGWTAPGARLVRDGSFLGVVGEREDDVDRALDALATAAEWEEADTLPDEDDLGTWLTTAPAETTTVVDEAPPAATRSSTYTKPYLAHASVAPSCGMARWGDDGTVHVWSHSQGIHRLRDAMAEALDLPRVR